MQITISGATRAGKQLRAASLVGPEAMAAALSKVAETVMTASKRDYVPVDTGALRASGHVQPSQVTATGASVELGFGGPAAPYAAIVHEDLLATHPVGQAKYLETPLRAAVQGMAAVLASYQNAAVRRGIQTLAKAERRAAAG